MLPPPWRRAGATADPVACASAHPDVEEVVVLGGVHLEAVHLVRYRRHLVDEERLHHDGRILQDLLDRLIAFERSLGSTIPIALSRAASKSLLLKWVSFQTAPER